MRYKFSRSGRSLQSSRIDVAVDEDAHFEARGYFVDSQFALSRTKSAQAEWRITTILLRNCGYSIRREMKRETGNK